MKSLFIHTVILNKYLGEQFLIYNDFFFEEFRNVLYLII